MMTTLLGMNYLCKRVPSNFLKGIVSRLSTSSFVNQQQQQQLEKESEKYGKCISFDVDVSSRKYESPVINHERLPLKLLVEHCGIPELENSMKNLSIQKIQLSSNLQENTKANYLKDFRFGRLSSPLLPTSSLSSLCSTGTFSSFMQRRGMASLEYMHKTGPHRKKRPPRKPLDGAPMLKGVVLKTLIKKPKKPNSANRKCVLVRLSNGKEKVAYVPGIGHNLQEHNIVLVRVGRLRDVPGVKLKCIRGKYDLPHVMKATQK